MTSPHYIVTAEIFRCGDESGPDWLGSDEPYWVFTAKLDNGKVHTTRSEVFGDVDSGESRRFDTKDHRNIVWPAKGAVRGAPGPVGLSIQLWEHDQGDPDKVREVTENTLDLAGLVVPWVGQVPDVVRDQIMHLISDDLMGSRTVFLSVRRLARLSHVGASMTLTLPFHGRSGDLPFDVAGGPDYTLTLRVIRTA